MKWLHGTWIRMLWAAMSFSCRTVWVYFLFWDILADLCCTLDVEGDKICIFGFSRGAYTARGLAGMLHKVGLLPADNLQQVPFAYKMYTRIDHIGWEQSNGFKKAFCIDVAIEFIGVW